MTLPEGDADFAVRWQLIKGCFSRALPSGEPVSASRLRRRERGIWQRRYWEHTLRDADDTARRLDYIQPGQARLCRTRRRPAFSSLRRMIRLGRYPESWAAGIADDKQDFGER